MPDPAVVVAMREFKQGLLAREAGQMQVMAKQWLAVENALDGRIVELTKDIAARRDRGEVVSEARMYRLERYQRLIGQTQREFGKYADWADKDLAGYQRQNGVLGINQARTAIQLSYTPAGVGVMFDRLPYEAVENMVGMARNGQPLGELLKLRMVKDARGRPLPGVFEKLTSSLVVGTALGRNPRVVANDMKDDLSGGLAKALVIARTEGLRPYKEMSRSQYEASGVVDGHKRLSAHDGRVCGACLADEGTLYRVYDSISDHPNGRCTSVPVVKGMPEIEWLQGEDWLRTQSEGVQRSVLGNARFELWNRGLFDFKNLVQKSYSSEWGASISPTPAYKLAPKRAPKPPEQFSGTNDAVAECFLYGEEEGKEFLIFLDADGNVITRTAGTETVLEGETPAGAIVSVHNHPQEVGFSSTDLATLLSGDLQGLVVVDSAGTTYQLNKTGETPSAKDLYPDKASPEMYMADEIQKLFAEIVAEEQRAFFAKEITEMRSLEQLTKVLVSKVTAKYNLTYSKQSKAMTPVAAQSITGAPKPSIKPPPGAWLTVIEAAAYANLSTSRIRGLIKDGRLVSKRDTRKGRMTTLVDPTSIDAYLASKGKKPPPPPPPPPPPVMGWVTVGKAATLVSLSTARVRGLLKEGKLDGQTMKSVDTGRNVMHVSMASIDAYLIGEGKKASTGKPPKGYSTSDILAGRFGITLGAVLVIIQEHKVSSTKFTIPGGPTLTLYNDAEFAAGHKKWKAAQKPKGYEPLGILTSKFGVSSTEAQSIILEARVSLRIYTTAKGTQVPVYHVKEFGAALKKWREKKKVTGWLTVTEAANYAGLSTARIRGLAKEGKVTGARRENPKTGRPQQMINQSSLDAYLVSRGKTPKGKKVKPTTTVQPTPQDKWKTPGQIDNMFGYPKGTSRKIVSRHGITGHYNKRRNTFVYDPEQIRAIADAEGVQRKRTMDERRAEAAEVRQQMLAEFGSRRVGAKEKNAAVRKYLEVPEEQRTEFRSEWTSSHRMAEPRSVKAGLSQLSRLVGRRSVFGKRHTTKFTYEAGRAHHAYDRGVVIDDYDGKKIVLHEMGHELEHRDKEIHREAFAFLARRTKGESLAWLGNGYDKDEKTRKDKFLHAYMGKDYQRYATEIISMGLEYMYYQPVHFAEKDPDMFDFIYAILRE